jgi:hypothetical protein
MFRTAITRQARLFTTSTRLQKGPIELGKDALKKVDRVVSDAAVKGIETGGMSSSVIAFGSILKALSQLRLEKIC